MPKKRRKARTPNQVSYWHDKLIGKSGGKFSRFIRIRDSAKYMANNPRQNEVGAACISCPVFYPIKKLQAGHFITSKKTHIKYNIFNVHAQCYNCNINLKGNWVGYEENMIRIYGQEKVDELMETRNIIKKFTVMELEELYDFCIAEIRKYEKTVGKIW